MNEKQIMKSDNGINTVFINTDNGVIMLMAYNDGVIAKINKDGDCYIFNTSEIIEAWNKYGGSFLQNLGKTLGGADLNNTYKILNTFLNYVGDYYDVILKIKKDYENNKF